jgi:hypothetical protein
MTPFDTLKSALSDILTFTGDLGVSKSGSLRLELDSSKKRASLSIALPDPSVPQLHLLSASAIVVISVLLPSYAKSQTILQESSTRFGAGHDSAIVEQSSEGFLTLSYNRRAFVYELVAELR